MNDSFSDMLMNGILICLYAQLIIIGVINILNNKGRSIILGCICCLLSLSVLYTIYLPDLNYNWVANILMGGYKHMFLPSLIYLYLVLLITKNGKQNYTIIKHLIAPLFVHGLYLGIKFIFREFYADNAIDIIAFVNFFIFFSYVFYLYKGVSLSSKLKMTLLSNMHKRYIMFLVVLSIYGIVLVTEAMLPYLFETDSIKTMSRILSPKFYANLAIPLNLGMLVFAFIDSPSLKSVVLGEKIYTGFDSIRNDDKIVAFIKDAFNQKKLYVDSAFNLKIVLIQSKIDEKEFKLFLRKEYSKSPTEFINMYRVNEFKELISVSENSRFSLMEIAGMVGFNSKATFYRNFKNMEGITPKQFLAEINKD